MQLGHLERSPDVVSTSPGPQVHLSRTLNLLLSAMTIPYQIEVHEVAAIKQWLQVMSEIFSYHTECAPIQYPLELQPLSNHRIEDQTTPCIEQGYYLSPVVLLTLAWEGDSGEFY